MTTNPSEEEQLAKELASKFEIVAPNPLRPRSTYISCTRLARHVSRLLISAQIECHKKYVLPDFMADEKARRRISELQAKLDEMKESK